MFIEVAPPQYRTQPATSPIDSEIEKLRRGNCGTGILSRDHLYPDNSSTADGWAWSQIKQRLPADFGDRCGGWLDQEDDPAWRDTIKCRTIPAGFLVDILTKQPLRDAITYKGVGVRGAKIVGEIDLTFAKFDRPFRSRIAGSKAR